MEITFNDDGTDAPKLEAVSRVWGQIQDENKADKKWVTPEQWRQWVEYDKSTVSKLSAVIERFDGARLSSEDNAILEGIIKVVGGVKRVTAKEFAEQHKAAEAAEREREQQRIAAAERQRELKGFKATLKGFFSK